MRYLILTLSLIVSGCHCEHIVTPVPVKDSFDNFEVVKLFEKDGCPVYRFTDGGSWRYFVTCSGSTTESHMEGKITKHNEIQTVNNKETK